MTLYLLVINDNGYVSIEVFVLEEKANKVFKETVDHYIINQYESIENFEAATDQDYSYITESNYFQDDDYFVCYFKPIIPIEDIEKVLHPNNKVENGLDAIEWELE